MKNGLLGKILATIATAAVDAGAIETNPAGVVENPSALSELVTEFCSIWIKHPASGVPQANAPIKVGA